MQSLTATLPTVSLYAPDFVGFLMPPVIQILNHDVKNEGKRFLISFALCVLIAFFFSYNKLVLGDMDAFIKSAGIIFMEAQIVYRMYFKNSFLSSVIAERLTKTEGQPVG